MVSRVLKIISIILLSLLIIGLCIVFILLFNNKISFKSFESKLIYDKNITDFFDTIKVSTKSLDIQLVKSNNNVSNVKVYDKKDNEISVKVEDKTLIIDSNKNKSWCFLCFGKNKAVISLPEKEYNLIVNSTSGDIESNVDLNDVTIVATSGDIELNKTNDFVATVVSGDIEVKEAHNLVISSTSGDIEIGKIKNSLEIETTSGDINIEDLTIDKNSSIRVISGDININKSSGNIYFDAKVTSGDVLIGNNNRHGDYELKINAKSGDIRVK